MVRFFRLIDIGADQACKMQHYNAPAIQILCNRPYGCSCNRYPASWSSTNNFLDGVAGTLLGAYHSLILSFRITFEIFEIFKGWNEARFRPMYWSLALYLCLDVDDSVACTRVCCSLCRSYRTEVSSKYHVYIFRQSISPISHKNQYESEFIKLLLLTHSARDIIHDN